LNAVEAMSSVDDPPRELSISTERAGVHEMLVAVRDSGPGVDPERERVFDSFYTTKPSGRGLGLSISMPIEPGTSLSAFETQVRKAPPGNASFAIKDAINELIALTRSEVIQKRVTVRSRLTEGLPSVQGDRVQLHK
jgi:C4-dicarboxylate-specific signal transduction histidine kinase